MYIPKVLNRVYFKLPFSGNISIHEMAASETLCLKDGYRTE